MVLRVSKSSISTEAEHISFPAEAAKVRSVLIALEEFGGYAPANMIRGEGSAQALTGYIKRDDLFSEAGIQKLNQLTGLVDTMPITSLKVFTGALRAESVNGLDDVLVIAASLSQYELIEGVTCDKELGGWLVEHGQAGVDFPEAVRPYLDYAGIGAEYYASHGGAYTPNGYVKRREVIQEAAQEAIQEAIQEQAVEEPSKFALTLDSPTGTFRLNLPASEDKLEQAKRALGLDSLDSAAISDVKIDYTWSHLLPMDGITLEDANTLAQCVQVMTNEELRVFGAALEVEEPRSFYDAGCIAMDRDDYELVEGSERAYAWKALCRAGADEEVLELLEGFTDFDALGRLEMEQDGVRETSFGLIRRCSKPFDSPCMDEMQL